MKFKVSDRHRARSRPTAVLQCSSRQKYSPTVIASSILPGRVDKSVRQPLYEGGCVGVSQSYEYLPSDVSWSCDQHASASGVSFSISGLLRETVEPATLVAGTSTPINISSR